MGSDDTEDGDDEGRTEGGDESSLPDAPSNLLDSTDLSMDEMLDILASQERREILHTLSNMDEETISFDEVVRVLVDFREEESGRRPSFDQMQGTLLHVHLPKFEETGIIEYDERSEQLRYRGDSRLEAWLKLVEDAQAAEE